jgi:curved DNA-binding protein CbpA
MADSSPERGVDLYEMLEVSANASPEVIQAAYKVLARTWHPDVRKDAAAERRIRDINTAYHVLSDTGRRATYDLQRARERRRERMVGATVSHPAKPRAALAVRSRADVLAARQRANQLSVERAPSLTGRIIILVAAVAALVSIVVLLVWLTFVWAADDSPFPDRGPTIELHSGGGPTFVAPRTGVT